MYTRRRRGSTKQKGGRTRLRSRSSTARTQSQRTAIPSLKAGDLSPEEKKLMEIFMAFPDKIKNTFILNKKILTPRQRAILKLAMEHKKGKIDSVPPIAESTYRNE